MISSHLGVARIPLSEALALGPEKWDRLVAGSSLPSPFMRWAWHQAWVEAAPADEIQDAFVVASYDLHGDIQALIPLRLCRLEFRRKQATAVGWTIDGLGAPDHLDVPAAPGAPLDAVVPLLAELPWDVIVLRHVAEDAPGVARLASAVRRRGLSVRRTATESCPYLDLPAEWDAYLATLHAARRQTIRRKERLLRREHAVCVTDYAPNRLEEGWRRLRVLHERRWGNAGIFADVRLDRLLRRFDSALAPRDELWLTTLDLDGECAAAWYGFAWKDTVYFYQSGRDPRWESRSVGLVLMAMMIRRAIERGYRRFDFLRGDEAYKRSWTSTRRHNYELVVFRRGWRGRLLRGLDVVARARAKTPFK